MNPISARGDAGPLNARFYLFRRTVIEGVPNVWVGLTIDINVVDDMRGNTTYTRESYTVK